MKNQQKGNILWILCTGPSIAICAGTSCWSLDQHHCANLEGNANCAGRGGYCNSCLAENDGCAGAPPEDERCYFPGDEGTRETDATTTSGVLEGGAEVTAQTADSSGQDTIADGDGDSTGDNNDCRGRFQLEMNPSEAIHSGDWRLWPSMYNEGDISRFFASPDPDGSVAYSVEIPCDDTWHVWVRRFDHQGDDSYFVSLDDVIGVYEGDCTNNPSGYEYAWGRINWTNGSCTYIENPRTPYWEEGAHRIEFTYRESTALGRILVTNDESYVP